MIVPTTGRSEQLLARAVNSVLEQEYQADEIIVVKSRNFPISPHWQQSTSIKVVDWQSDLGASAARNRGFEASTGEFVSFLDDDDWFERDYLSQVVDALRTQGRAVTGALRIHRPQATVEICSREKQIESVSWLVFGNPGITGSNFACTADLYDALGGYDENLVAFNDLDLALRCVLAGESIHVHKGIANQEARHTARISSDLVAKIAALDTLRRKCRSRLRPHDILRLEAAAVVDIVRDHGLGAIAPLSAGILRCVPFIVEHLYKRRCAISAVELDSP